MENYTAIIVGGGAAGMMCALRLKRRGVGVLLLERNDRLGRKLSATGNGQGNVTNEDMSAEHYFSSTGSAAPVLGRFGKDDLLDFLHELGGLFSADGEGRVYPASRQASSVTDIFRFALAESGVRIALGEKVLSARRASGGFLVSTEKGEYASRALVLACGGKASPHFGSDGSGYELAAGFGHTVTALASSLVRLKTERGFIAGLKGIRCDCRVVLSRPCAHEKKRGEVFADTAVRGDVLFTESGLSGDAIFRLSARVREGDELCLDFLPDFGTEEVVSLLQKKAEKNPRMRAEDLLRCVVHGAVGRAALRRCNIAPDSPAHDIFPKLAYLAGMLTFYPVKVTGTEGFANAQVTKGGVPLSELDSELMSRRAEGLYFAGELLDIDGECGGYNLQWAFSSGAVVADAIAERFGK